MTTNKTDDGVVVLDYADLSSSSSSSSSVDLTASLQEAFGDAPACLGILLVRGVPGYAQRRQALLPLGTTFAALPDSVKEKVVHADSFYSVGWSHGKEKFKGRFDVAKGSFYANPQLDVPTEDPDMRRRYPEYCHPNLWPSDDCPQLEAAFKDLGQLIVQVGTLVANQCDRLLKQHVKDYPDRHLFHCIEQSRCCKGRLLHYFPNATAANSDITDDMDSWCGWHYDHGSLTGLTSAMFIDESTGKEVPPPDARAGLYIKSRGGAIVKAKIPADCIAYQIGQSMQIASGGVFQATYHCVRAASSEIVARNTLAVFMQPNWDALMVAPQGSTPDSVGVDVWSPNGQTFAEFSKILFEKYYS